MLLFQKYPTLPISPGVPPEGATNDWVDEQLIEALSRNAVNAIVTEDKRLARKAVAKLGPDRILSLSDAIVQLSGLVDTPVQPPPVVRAVHALDLDPRDPIWQSFREDYLCFDDWFRKYQLEHRKAWVIPSEDNTHIAGVVIVNHETAEPIGSKTLKVCSLKVEAHHGGKRYGELLMKALFTYALANQYDSLLITAFPKYDALLALLGEFGFRIEPELRSTGELVLTKRLRVGICSEATNDALDYHVGYGPAAVDILGPPVYVVPIIPQYHRMLFPDLERSPTLFPGREAYGNSIRKAYLSRSAIAVPEPGAVLLFYRSEDEQAVRCLGVTEGAIRSRDPQKIGTFVIARTVYTPDEIASMCLDREVLAIRFRQCLLPITLPITRDELVKAGVIAAPPQSITKVKEDCKPWLIERLRRPS
ncbi:MAG: GNAT family N-acetyltransferase [Armatimonadetes bacterium ATM1]|nr:GNAT family N-acetyltransferase [Armatimonadota bacterium]MCE7899601.1 GNAT family N-acetyltransferase [Armatimonadetes bacterium ATM1]RIJ96387.1 MAG: hypothetical protein DCC45_06920 [Armatimonadota bacterium]